MMVRRMSLLILLLIAGFVNANESSNELVDIVGVWKGAWDGHWEVEFDIQPPINNEYSVVYTWQENKNEPRSSSIKVFRRESPNRIASERITIVFSPKNNGEAVAEGNFKQKRKALLKKVEPEKSL